MDQLTDITNWLEAAIEERRLPKTFIVYDTETYSEVDLPNRGAMVYHADASTELMMLQYLVIEDGVIDPAGVRVWEYGDPLPTGFTEKVAAGWPLFVFNVFFERVLYELILGPEMGFPVPTPAQWHDTAAMARSLGIQGSLDVTAQALGIPYQKQTDGKALIRRFCIPRKPTKNDDRTRIYPGDDPDRWSRFIEYGIQDVWVTLGVATQTRVLSKFERRIAELNYQLNWHGLPIDVKCVRTAMKWSDRITKELTDRVVEITGIKPSQVGKLTEWLGLPNLQAATVEKALASEEYTLASEEYTPEQIEVLKARQVLAKASITKLKKMLAVITADNRVSGGFLYAGAARTGRDAGRLVQPHNFPRPKLKQAEIDRLFTLLERDDYDTFREEFAEPGEALSSALRGMIAVGEGRGICVADYSAIEARLLVWICGESRALREFHEGLDTYKLMAVEIFGLPSPEHVDDDQRKLGKDTVLGCGYNMGPPTFRAQLAARGVEVSATLAERAVLAYRKKHRRVVAGWKEIEKMAMLAIRKPHQTFTALKGKLTLYYRRIGMNPYLFIVLPSGRALTYLRARVVSGDYGAQIRFDGIFGSKVLPEHTYGGKLMENVVQAAARDLMVNGMLEAHRAGYALLGTVHDEIISEVDWDGETEPHRDFERVITKLPKWADGMPLKAEGYTAKRYRKG